MSNSISCCQLGVDSCKAVAEDPGKQRIVIKAIIAVFDTISLVSTLSSKSERLVFSLGVTDDSIRILSGFGLIPFWVNYQWRNTMIFLRDAGDTIVTAFALPNLLNRLGAIDYAWIAKGVGKIPVLGQIPLNAALSALTIFVSSITIALSGRKIWQVETGHFEEKVEKWRQLTPVGIKEKIDKKFGVELSEAQLVNFRQHAIHKWEKRALHKDQILRMEAVNILFHLVVIALMVFTILSACAITFVGLPVLMTLCTIAIAGIGAFVLIHDLLYPRSEWGGKIQLNELQ